MVVLVSILVNGPQLGARAERTKEWACRNAVHGNTAEHSSDRKPRVTHRTT